MKPTSFITFLPLASFAHVMMKDPPPRRSKHSEHYRQSGLVDYNLVAPINAGYSFPCKGFPPGPATKTVGKNVQITLEGSAIHGGGHCQFGISYDNVNFLVLKTVPKNCLLNSMTYDFDLPDNVANTKTIVFWTWINAIGNREYYMDCADVNVITESRSDSPSPVSGKELFVANLPGYPTVPEFPRSDMYDGSDLLLSQKITTISPRNSNFQLFPVPPPTPPLSTTPPMRSPLPIVQTPRLTPPTDHRHSSPPSPSPSPSPQLPPTPPPSPQLPPTPPPSPSENCQTGDMKCGSNGGFDTCVFNKRVWRACAPGTSCKMISGNMICDFAQ